MATKEEINGYFMEAIRRLKAEGFSQEYIVKKAKLSQNTITKIKNGKNNCGDVTIQKLCKAFQLNPDFFYGKNEHFTLLELKRAKLDKDIEEAQAVLSRTEAPLMPQSHTDYSSLMNAALAAKDESIASLKREAQAKDETIASLKREAQAKEEAITSLKRELQTKEELVNSLKTRVMELNAQLARYQTEESARYPFKVGVADDGQ